MMHHRGRKFSRLFEILMMIASLVLIKSSVEAKVQCLDSDGKSVDWWLMIKLGSPVTPDGGYTTAYVDVHNPSTWAISNINRTTGNALYHTIRQVALYGGTASKTTVGWALWNDQTHHDLNGSCDEHVKDGKGGVYAHSKGTIGFDSSTGFWLSHSCPGFPYDHSLCPSSWYFPKSQTEYAQHFFCVSISTADLDKFASFLQYYHNYIYDSNIPSSLSSGLPNFKAYVAGTYKSTETSITFTSLGGQQFTAVGKYAGTNADIHEDYVAPLLKTGLHVQTWCGGTFGDSCQPSYCQGKSILSPPSDPQRDSGRTTYAYDSIQVESMSFGSSLTYPNKYNHAKWAISEKNSPSAWFCSSDNNREITQRGRGGGSICLQHPQLWSSLHGVIKSLNTTCA